MFRHTGAAMPGLVNIINMELSGHQGPMTMDWASTEASTSTFTLTFWQRHHRLDAKSSDVPEVMIQKVSQSLQCWPPFACSRQGQLGPMPSLVCSQLDISQGQVEKCHFMCERTTHPLWLKDIDGFAGFTTPLTRVIESQSQLLQLSITWGWRQLHLLLWFDFL